MQGNADLAAEKFPEATAAFHRARELDPKRAHVADRLAEVARRQQRWPRRGPQPRIPDPLPARHCVRPHGPRPIVRRTSARVMRLSDGVPQLLRMQPPLEPCTPGSRPGV